VPSLPLDGTSYHLFSHIVASYRLPRPLIKSEHLSLPLNTCHLFSIAVRPHNLVAGPSGTVLPLLELLLLLLPHFTAFISYSMHVFLRKYCPRRAGSLLPACVGRSSIHRPGFFEILGITLGCFAARSFSGPAPVAFILLGTVLLNPMVCGKCSSLQGSPRGRAPTTKCRPQPQSFYPCASSRSRCRSGSGWHRLRSCSRYPCTPHHHHFRSPRQPPRCRPAAGLSLARGRLLRLPRKIPYGRGERRLHGWIRGFHLSPPAHPSDRCPTVRPPSARRVR
jgi:hypothetical protein